MHLQRGLALTVVLPSLVNQFGQIWWEKVGMEVFFWCDSYTKTKNKKIRAVNCKSCKIYPKNKFIFQN